MHKRYVQQLWAAEMGALPHSRVATAVTSHTRIARRVGNYMMCYCMLPALVAIKADVAEAYRRHHPGGNKRVVLWPRRHDIFPSARVQAEQRVLFQCISADGFAGVAFNKKAPTV